MLEFLNSLRLLWSVLSPRRRRQLILLQFIGFAAALAEVANLGALLPFLRLLANPRAGIKATGPLADVMSKTSNEILLIFLGVVFASAVLLSSILRSVSTRSQLRLASLITADIGNKVFSTALSQPFSWHIQNNTSIVLSHLTKDVDQVSGCIQSVLTIIVNSLIVIFIGISLLALNPSIIISLAALLSVSYITIYRYTRGTFLNDGNKVVQHYQPSLKIVQEALGGIRDILLDGSSDYFLSIFNYHNREYRLATASINIRAQIPRYLIEGIASILIAGLTLFLALSGQSIEQQLPLLGALTLGAYRLLQPAQQCFSAWGNYQACRPALQLLKPFLNFALAPERIQRNISPETSNIVDAVSIELKDVSFSYSKLSQPIIDHINLTISPGERVGLIGKSGSGKSTISDLVLGLLRPSHGEILVNGKSFHEDPIRLKNWQHSVAHVPQHIYLADASLSSNIAFGIPEDQIDHARLKFAIHNANLEDVLRTCPNGLQTLIGERGVRLSGGQRQRIGIARAFYKQAKFLALDEATSALDTQTESEVMSCLNSLDRRITLLIIAHRLSTLQCCDRVIVLDHGKIKQIGTYAEIVLGH